MRLLSAMGVAAGVCGALVLAPVAQARDVTAYVRLKDSNGYEMSIGASRSSGRGADVIFARDSRRLRAAEPPALRDLAQQPAPLRALAGKVVAGAAGPAKLDRAARRGRKGSLSVQVSKRRTFAGYGVAGTVTRRLLFGRVGEYGRVFLHFHVRKERTLHLGCLRIPIRVGTFEGRVRFDGEDDYVNVSADRARGQIILPPKRLHCRSRAQAAPPRRGGGHARGKRGHSRGHHHYTELYAHSADRFFDALKEASTFSAFFVGTFEEHGPVSVVRFGYNTGKPSEFRFNRRLTSARIAPKEAPFEHGGDFRAPHRWTGPLSASLPGAPDMRLAGRGFRAALERSGGRLVSGEASD